MGTGKTSTGKILAKKLGYAFFDTDICLEKKIGMKIADIFIEKGEEYFRLSETRLLETMFPLTRTVIATGGGIVKRKGNLEILKKNGILISLLANVDSIYQRTLHKGRPLLDKVALSKRKEEIASILEERKNLYKTGDIVIDTEDTSPFEVSREIMSALKVRGFIRG